MSAIPFVRAVAPDLQSWGQLPAGPWRDESLPWFAKITLGALAILARGRPEFDASIADICDAGGISKSTAHRGLATLESRGILARNPTGPRFTLLYLLRGRRSVIPIGLATPPESSPGVSDQAPPPVSDQAPPGCPTGHPQGVSPDTPPVSRQTPPPAVALMSARASERVPEEEEIEKSYLPNPTPEPLSRACACEGRATGRRPINPFAEIPPELAESDPVLRAELARRSGGTRMGVGS